MEPPLLTPVLLQRYAWDRIAIVPLDGAAYDALSSLLSPFSDRWWHPTEGLWTLPSQGASLPRFLRLLSGATVLPSPPSGEPALDLGAIHADRHLLP